MLKKGKVTIVGAGYVGSTTAFAIMQSSVVNEIVLIDVNVDKAEGDVLDMSHGVPFIKPLKIKAGDYSDAKGSEIVIITAGANQKPDETRIDLLKRNKVIFNDIVSKLKENITEETIILVVTNPVDILTYLTYKLSGFPSNMVIGSGTVLDTARLRYSVSEVAKVDGRNVHAYILGEHGDSEVPIWSGATIGTMSVDEYCRVSGRCSILDKDSIFNDVKTAAYSIIEKKGATFYAVALAVKRIVECILRNEKSILTVSSLIDGIYGISDVCLSVPTILGKNGADTKLEINLSDDELSRLQASANTLKSHIKEILS